jgi:hypothetical protein
MLVARRIGSDIPGHDRNELPQSNGLIKRTDHSTAVIQRGEASVHHDIEETATEGIDPRLLKEMYAGNWMRDFSQLNLPMPHSLVANLPKDVDEPTGESIGAEGAEDIITSVIRALAFLEFGPEITNDLITPGNIGVYTPEQHVDNPMGTTAANHLVRDSGSGSLRPGRPQDNPLSSQPDSDDPDRDTQLAGKAFPGLQTENPELFEVSDAGLTKHIYNAIEWTKEQLGSAVSAGESPQGRMFLGSALHAVEDYFAHSNFIEVALNSEIDRVISTQYVTRATDYSVNFLRQAEENRDLVSGNYVDTLYDARSSGGRMAITTGTAGPEDLKVSLGQIVLPRLPGLTSIINRKIDEALNLIIETDGESGWDEIQETLKSDEGGYAAIEVISALDRHIKVPVYNIYLTGYDIPLTDRFIPTGWETSKSSKGVVRGIQDYIALYRRIQLRFNELETAVNILFPITLLFDLKKKFTKLFRAKIGELKKAVQTQINEFLLSLVEEITGLDLKEEKEKGIEHALNYAANVGVEHLREGTSIESQLPEIKEKYKDDPEGLYQAYGIIDDDFMPALPPSHSEISKDHPPHEDDDHKPLDALSGYDVSEGSLFYQIHHNLAVEADKHIIKKLQQVWDDQLQANSANALETTPTIDPNVVMDEARQHQAREEQRAAGEGRQLRTFAHEGPSVQDLMALVDYFISHPADTSWWKPILTDYVNSNEEEIISHIRQRNRTREKRN